MQERLAYSIAEAAEVVGLSERKLRELLMQGEIASRKVGSRRIIPRRALEAWLDGDGVHADDAPDTLRRRG